MWIAFSCNPLLSPDSLSVQLPCDRLLVAKQSWLSAAYGPPLKTYVSHFDPVIGTHTGRPLTPFFWSGFWDTLDRLTAQNMKGISFLVELLYAG